MHHKKIFLEILQYGKQQYFKGSVEAIKFDYLWPRSWQTAIKMLERQGYRDPENYFICLDNSHPCHYSILSSSTVSCKYCGNSSSTCIKYSYLPLRYKIKQWCSSPIFCEKMTAHCKEKDHWLNSTDYNIKKEIWDGSRFAELSWFWDPLCEWTLPVLCPFCRAVTSGSRVEELASQQNNMHITVHCHECHMRFDCEVRKANGDPRNIALIGHWDGWQPFSLTSKHSSGMYMYILANTCNSLLT